MLRYICSGGEKNGRPSVPENRNCAVIPSERLIAPLRSSEHDTLNIAVFSSRFTIDKCPQMIQLNFPLGEDAVRRFVRVYASRANTPDIPFLFRHVSLLPVTIRKSFLAFPISLSRLLLVPISSPSSNFESSLSLRRV